MERPLNVPLLIFHPSYGGRLLLASIFRVRGLLAWGDRLGFDFRPIRPAFSGCPVRSLSRYQVLAGADGTPRAAMSARLITGRPLIAGIGATSSRSRTRKAARHAASGLVPPSGR